MAALEHRAATLDLSEGCARCGVAVGEPPPATAGISGGSVPQFYLFPSGNAFHGTCLASEVLQLVPPTQQQRINTLLTRLSQVQHNYTACSASAVGKVELDMQLAMWSSPVMILSVAAYLEAWVIHIFVCLPMLGPAVHTNECAVLYLHYVMLQDAFPLLQVSSPDIHCNMLTHTMIRQ